MEVVAHRFFCAIGVVGGDGVHDGLVLIERHLPDRVQVVEAEEVKVTVGLLVGIDDTGVPGRTQDGVVEAIVVGDDKLPRDVFFPRQRFHFVSQKMGGVGQRVCRSHPGGPGFDEEAELEEVSHLVVIKKLGCCIPLIGGGDKEVVSLEQAERFSDRRRRDAEFLGDVVDVDFGGGGNFVFENLLTKDRIHLVGGELLRGPLEHLVRHRRGVGHGDGVH